MVNVEFDAKALLGEGPCWDERTETLYWVDIERKQLHAYSPLDKADKVYTFTEEVGAAVVREAGGLVLALKSGFHFFDPLSGKLEHITDPEAGVEDNRFNDGKCDPRGRFWAGTMHHPETESERGSLYSLEIDHSTRCHVTGVSVSNGLAWNSDATIMYYIDSPERECWAFDFDLETGVMSNKRVAVRIPEGYGYPDGMTIDAEGMLWIALWDGWRVCRFNPHDGSLLQEIKMPVARPTSCVFGGPELTTLYVTSASTRQTPEVLAGQPNAGAIFTIEAGVKGTPSFRFRG